MLSRNIKGDHDGAIVEYKAIELNPLYDGVYFAHGNARFAKDEWDGSVADYTKVIELTPNNAPA